MWCGCGCVGVGWDGMAMVWCGGYGCYVGCGDGRMVGVGVVGWMGWLKVACNRFVCVEA